MLQVSRWTPFASVLLVSLICGGVVANNSAMMWMGGNTAASPSGVVSLPARILLSVILVSTIVRMKWTTAHHDAHSLPGFVSSPKCSTLFRLDSFVGLRSGIRSAETRVRLLETDRTHDIH